MIQVKDLWSNGNAYSILAKCSRSARKSGWTTAQIDAFLNSAKEKDYDHLIQTVMKHFEEWTEDNAGDVDYE